MSKPHGPAPYVDTSNFTRPRIVTGDDGLPHCATCLKEPNGCSYHRKQVHEALGQLKTSSRTSEMDPQAKLSSRVTMRGEREE